MRLDMSFWEKQEGFIYGITISMDQENNKYGWRAIIYSGNGEIVCEFFWGEIYVESMSFSLLYLPIKKKNVDVNMISVEQMIAQIVPILDTCVIYTGAGIAMNAGIWGLRQLRQYLCLNSLKEFQDTIESRKEDLLEIIEEFAQQLYTAVPTETYEILGNLQKKYSITIITENRDNLHQFSKHNVITRDVLKRFPLFLMKKALIVVGLSDDHSGIIQLYNKLNKDKPIFVINNQDIPGYCKSTDFFCKADLNIFFAKMKEVL